MRLGFTITHQNPKSSQNSGQMPVVQRQRRQVRFHQQERLLLLLLLLLLLTAFGLSPGGSTQLHTTIHKTTQIKILRKTQIAKKKECGRVRAVPRLKMRVLSWHLSYN
jgi:hypothetical protein